jgi:hypothetical protein
MALKTPFFRFMHNSVKQRTIKALLVMFTTPVNNAVWLFSDLKMPSCMIKGVMKRFMPKYMKKARSTNFSSMEACLLDTIKKKPFCLVNAIINNAIKPNKKICDN